MNFQAERQIFCETVVFSTRKLTKKSIFNKNVPSLTKTEEIFKRRMIQFFTKQDEFPIKEYTSLTLNKKVTFVVIKINFNQKNNKN